MTRASVMNKDPVCNSPEDIYQAIGKSIFAKVSPDFLDAWVPVQLSPNMFSIELFFRTPSQRISYRVLELEDTAELFRKLHSLCDAKSKWTTATFHLNSSGRMSLDLGYENVEDFNVAPTARNAWIERYLGKDSAIDWQ